MHAQTEPHEINFAWLIRLRWGAISGQVATVLAVARLLNVRLPLLELFAVIGVEAASNVACALLARSGRPAREWWLAAAMGFDTLVLTALLYLSGGPFNPFSFLYLVQIALAAVVLRERWTWALVLLAVACSAVLFAAHRPLALDGTHAEHMSFHLRGMWVAFVVAAAFIVYFLMRVMRALAAREADLQAARQLAARQEKLASLATLAAGAAHELSTPLSTIALAAKELERHVGAGAAPSVTEDVALIRSQVERCHDILARMTEDAGEASGEGPSRVAVRELLDGARAGLGEAPPVRVALDEAAADLAVTLPRRAVAQALHGLVKNAQEAGAGEVRVRAFVDGRRLCVEVRDEGAGMAPEVLARAGEPFFTTKPPGRGMGLGLFLTRALMQRLDGELRLASQPGRGTTATLVVPLAPPPADAAPRGANILRIAPGAGS